jgi:hypothetical protein
MFVGPKTLYIAKFVFLPSIFRIKKVTQMKPREKGHYLLLFHPFMYNSYAIRTTLSKEDTNFLHTR